MGGISFIRKYFDVLLHTSLIVLPMTAFTGILLGLVYSNLWDQNQSRPADLSLNSGYSSDILFVDYSATSLILVASWSSSVAVPAIGSLLSMTSFVVAAEMVWTSERALNTLLPSAGQLGLVTELLDGRKLALWNWFAEFWRRDGHRIQSRWIIELPAGMQLVGMFFGIGIIAADTWLHVATSSTTLWYLDKVDSPAQLAPDYQYSRDFKDTCSDVTSDICTTKPGSKLNTNQTVYSDDIKSLIMSDSLSDTMVNRSADGLQFLAPRLPDQATLVGADKLAFQTFSASTLGANASCEPSLKECTFADTMNSNGSYSFACRDGMKGDISPSDWLSIASWWQPNSSQDAFNTIWSHYENTSLFAVNIVETGFVAFLQDVNITLGNTGNASIEPSGLRRLEFASDDGKPPVSGCAVASQCIVSFFGASYSWTNDTALPVMDGTTQNSIGASLARAALLTGYFDTAKFDLDQKNVIHKALSDSLKISKADMVGKLQDVVGKIALSLLGGTTKPMPASALALANSAIVTQVEKGPLFTLIILNLWYASFALGLCCLTIFILRDETYRQDIIDVRKLVTVNGLAKSLIAHGKDGLPMKSSDLRVGVEKDGGKWKFRIHESPMEAGEGKALLAVE